MTFTRLNQFKVLANMENQIKFCQALESINPAVKSFLRGEKSVATSAIKSILNFVSHDKSATWLTIFTVSKRFQTCLGNSLLIPIYVMSTLNRC